MITNKDFKQYIVSLIDSEVYEIETKTDKQKVKFVLDSFNKEFNYSNNKKRYKNLVIRISEWLKCTPSIIDIEIWNEDIIRVAKEYKLLPLELTEAEEYNFAEYWFELCASTILSIAKENKINIDYLK